MKLSRLFTAACLIGAMPLQGQVIISEIMYNPDSTEGTPRLPAEQRTPNRVEWVELYNSGEEEVDLAGWSLSDEDGQTTPLKEDASIEPGEAVVLISSETPIDQFHTAWGEDIKVYQVDQWNASGLYNLANGPSPSNEVLQLLDAQGMIADEVNYDDENGWPSDSPDGSSIYLLPAALSAEANDLGESWARSVAEEHGGKANTQTDIFNGNDVGSPGHVTVE